MMQMKGHESAQYDREDFRQIGGVVFSLRGGFERTKRTTPGSAADIIYSIIS